MRAFGKRGAERGGLLVLLALFVAVGWWPSAALGQDQVRVEWVYDGDTCRLTGGQRLRLAGIDAPELAHDGRPAHYYAAESKAAVLRLVRGVSLRFVEVGAGHDRFDRLLGDLLLPDGSSVGERMVAEGAAFFFWFNDLPLAMTERLLAAQRRAMAAGKGFWPRLLSRPGEAGPYVGNAASRRFHAPNCPEGARIGRRNRVILASLTEAFAQGFAPARECTPWPAVR